VLGLRRQTPQARTHASHERTKETSQGFEPSRSVNLTVIGPLLKEAREKDGTSVAGAAEALFVKKSTLVAIESGQWETLPHPLYVKGYVKSYAAYLGVLEALETHLHPPDAQHRVQCSGKSKALPEFAVRAVRKDLFMTEPRRPILSRLALVLSSFAWPHLGPAASPGTQAAPALGFKDMLVACHLAIADVRRVILP
jgi:DNA-binding XRE family transcriptional regulator